MQVIDTIAADPIFQRAADALATRGGAVGVSGLWGACAPAAAGLLARRLGRPLLYITAHLDDADNARDDFETFFGTTPALLPAWEGLPGEGAGSSEIAAERARLCSQLGGGESPPIIIAPIQALMQPVPTKQALGANALDLRVGQRCDPEAVIRWLVERGFNRLDQVEEPGDFALRGGILDVFTAIDTDPIRLELFDDVIDSIRTFEPGSQRSVKPLEKVRLALPPDPTRSRPDDTTSFLGYLPTSALVALNEPLEIQELGRVLLQRLNRPVGLLSVDAVLRGVGDFAAVHLSRFAGSAVEAGRGFAARCEAPPQFAAKATDAVQHLAELARDGRVVVYCDNPAEVDRLRELIGQAPAAAPDRPAPAPVDAVVGFISTGFVWRATEDAGAAASIACIGNRELFHRYAQRRRIRKVTTGRPLDSFLDLQPDDHVVHVVHGIAKYVGMRTMRKGDTKKSEEFLTLRFAEGATMHVPASQIHLVQKYIGAGGARPTLSTLGGTRWKKITERVEEAVDDMAAELLRVQAEREAQPGIAYPADTNWQREFEESFLYSETPDQLTALAEIKADMVRARPMDRLLCGDVGYGKTELAIRAAFKAVEFGKQVAVLVPTTVLAEQHEQTFRERLADYPFGIESLSRFRSRKEQNDILARARKGQVDILIGTHRLLSKDVRFADLGLVIIDEEQRFGVEHKERLKQFRSTVDVLTLTATPIPRTLHMSMIGLRDISSLATAPLDRRSIQTRIAAWDDSLIRGAIVRELTREGQIYFVHNRVHSIQAICAKLAALVPEARYLVGHGQMAPDELEDVMVRFVRHEADVLVCTTIIEAGLDIPNVNTILIDRADNFGLADLHQLRGRVGRYKHRAYCHLLLSPDRPLTDTAAKRLKAIEEFSELGAGFRIAMRDLEIRGAGNILGPEQSGHIAAVGYEMYCRLLEQAVRRMKGEPPAPSVDVHLELDLEAYVPKHYIASDRQRMEVYRRICACGSAAEVAQLEADLLDAFGKFPSEVEKLLALADIRVRAAAHKIRSIVRRDPDLIFSIDDMRAVAPIFTGAAGSVRVIDDRTVHWRLPDQYFHGDTLLRVLRHRLGHARAGVPAGVA